VPVPVWGQNKGNIIQAQGALLRAVEEAHRVRSGATGTDDCRMARMQSALHTFRRRPFSVMMGPSKGR